MISLLLSLILSTAQASDTFRIGVVDSGVEESHPFLKKHLEIIDLKKQVQVLGDSDLSDYAGHGTHVSGIIIQNLPKSLKYKIVPFKNLEPIISGIARKEDGGIQEIVDFAIEHKIKVLNFSQSGGEFSQKNFDAFKKAGEHGILIVAASGNGDESNKIDLSMMDRAFAKIKETDPTRKQVNAYPCAYKLDNVLCVGNYMKLGPKGDTRFIVSNYGKETVDMLAFGEEVRSSCIDRSFCKMSGSSMSTPRVTAEVVKLWKKNPKLSPAEIKVLLLKKLPLDQKLTEITKTGKYLD